MAGPNSPEELLARLRHRPEDDEAFSALCEVYRAASDWDALAAVMEQRAAHLSDPTVAAHVIAEAADLVQGQLRQTERALALYRRAIELDPGFLYAMFSAREILRMAGRFDEAVALYEREIGAEEDGARKAALLVELGHLRVSVLRDIDGAIRDLYVAHELLPEDGAIMEEIAAQLVARADLGRTGAHRDRQVAAELWMRIAATRAPAEAVELAKRALDAVPDQERALTLFERLAPELGLSAELPIRWVHFLTHAPDAPSAAPRRMRLADAYAGVGQWEDAIACLVPLAEAGDAAAASKLSGLYERVGRPQDGERFAALALSALPADQRVVRLRAAAKEAEKRGDLEGLRAQMRAILEVDPSDAQAFSFLEEECVKRGAWAELRDQMLTSVRAAGAPVSLRVKRLREVAKISETRLSDLPGAIGAWRAVSTLDPVDPQARDALRRLLGEASRFDELAQILEKDVAAAGDSRAKAEALRRLAEVHRVHRGDLGSAITALSALVAIAPSDAVALEGLCDVLLEAGREAEALPLIARRLESAADAPTRARWLVRAGTIAAASGDTAQAEKHYDACVKLAARAEPAARREATAALVALYAQGARHEEAVELLRRALAVESITEERLSLRKQIARVLTEGIKDHEGAEREWQTILATAQDDEEALRALSALAEKKQDARKEAGYLARLAAVTKAPAARVAIVLRRTRLLREGLRAAEDARKELTALLDVADAAEDRLAVLDALAAVETDPSLLSARVREAATIAVDALGDENGAWRRLVAHITARPDPETEQALRDLAARTDRHEQLGDFFLWLASREIDPARKVRLFSDAGIAFESEAGGAAKAFEAWRRAYHLAPTQKGWFGKLEELAPRAGRVDALLDAYEERRKVAEDDDEALAVLLGAAAIADGKLRDRDRAFVYVGQAIMLSLRTSEGAARVEAAVRAMDEDPGKSDGLSGEDARRSLIDAYLQLAEKSARSDPAQAAELLVRAATLTDRELRDSAAAYPIFARASELAPDLAAATDGLRRLSARAPSGSVRAPDAPRDAEPAEDDLLIEEVSVVEALPDEDPTPQEFAVIEDHVSLDDDLEEEMSSATPPARPIAKSLIPKPPPKKR